jgi:glutathione S-transferase
MAEYVPIEEARAADGLRLVLTQGVPGPWGEAAKAIFHVKDVPYLRVAQQGGGDNDALVEWTGHANAPTAVYNHETPRAGRNEILLLAERIAPEPRLLPADAEERAIVFGLSEDIGGSDGWGWNRRHMLLAPMHEAADAPEPLAKTRDNLSGRYGFSAEAAARAPVRCVEILGGLAARLHRQRDAGSRYFVGSDLTAADLYWAAFCALAKPLPESLCPMNSFLRAGYTVSDPTILEALDPILLAHRDFIYERHLELPLEF